MSNGESIAVVVGASEGEFNHAKQCLSTWGWRVGSLADGRADLASISKRASLILVYAQRKEEDTLAICEQIRKAPETADTPLLVVIDRFLIAQAHAVNQLGNVGFLLTPFDEKELRDRIAKCFGLS